MNINSIRIARRMAVAAGGMVAAVSLVAGAGPASAHHTLAASAPMTAVCDSTKCTVQDADGIKKVVRTGSGGLVSDTPGNGAPKVDVFNEGKYDTATVTDVKGYSKTFNLIAPG